MNTTVNRRLLQKLTRLIAEPRGYSRGMAGPENLSSLRSDDDSWAITESVGATALGVAASRAVETAGADPLIRDEFAGALVSAAGAAWAGLADPEMAWLEGDEHGQRVHRATCDYHAVRTHFFDEYFGAAASAGIRQAVILAAGLDSRAYRLVWPSDMVVYEIDLPQVLEYKAAVLRSHGAVPAASRRAVPVDLRHDWPTALRSAGFDSARPTAWLAEGLLPYLPSDAHTGLLEIVTALSPPDSQFAFETYDLDWDGNKQRWERMRARLGLDLNVEGLMYHEPDRADPVHWLAERGWQVHGMTNGEAMARLGRPIPEGLANEVVHGKLLRARRT